MSVSKRSLSRPLLAWIFLVTPILIPNFASHRAEIAGGMEALAGRESEGSGALSPGQQTFLAGMAARQAERAKAGNFAPAAFCWSEGTPPEIMASFDAALRNRLEPAWYIIVTGRWFETATDGPGLVRGQPTVLTWGFLPDGTIADGAPSSLLFFLDAQYGAGPGGNDLTQRPWFPIFQQVFDRWSELCGVTYVYEPNDDGATFPDSPGVLGVRPDVRLAARRIDGHTGSNIYGYDYFPDSGDMVLDTDNAANFGNPAQNSILLRNVVAHEHGHGLGLAHSCPIEQTKLMEPNVTTVFDGPQHDDILGANRAYGDGAESPAGNDDPAHATILGDLAPGDTLRRALVTIDGENDVDCYAFTVPPSMRVSVTLTPTGFSYFNSPEQGNTCPIGTYFDSLVQNDLKFELVGQNGTDVLASAAYAPRGVSEHLENFLLTGGGGTYFVKAAGDSDKVQLYELSVTASSGQSPVAICKNVKSCQPSVDVLRVNNGSYDPDGDDITYSLIPEGPFAPGVTEVMLVVSDGFNADTCGATVTINRPPVAVAQNVAVVGDTLADCLAGVFPAVFDNGSYDPDGDALAFALVPPGPYPPGLTAAKFIVKDGCNATDTVDVTVTVSCAVPVALSRFTAERRGESAVISWAVADAEDHAGFHLHRQVPGMERVRLTDRLLTGRREYEFVDAGAPPGPIDYWLEERSRTGAVSWHGPVALGEALPVGALLASVRPNPFAGRATVTYRLPDTRGVTLEIFDAAGRKVRSLVDQVQGPGEHRVSWDGTGDQGERAVPGLYLVRLVAGDLSAIRKTVLLPGR